MLCRYWNVVWKYDRTEIFKKPEINQRINGNVSLILSFIHYTIVSTISEYKLKLFASSIKCEIKQF